MSKGFYVGNNLTKQFEARLDAAGIDYDIWSWNKSGTEYQFKDSDYEKAKTIIDGIRIMRGSEVPNYVFNETIGGC